MLFNYLSMLLLENRNLEIKSNARVQRTTITSAKTKSVFGTMLKLNIPILLVVKNLNNWRFVVGINLNQLDLTVPIRIVDAIYSPLVSAVEIAVCFINIETIIASAI